MDTALQPQSSPISEMGSMLGGPTPNADAQPSQEDVDPSVSVSSFVKQWTARIRAARTRFEPDFDRMREDMEFAAGFQWKDQAKLDDDRYTANMTLRFVNNKVSSLYARDPKVSAKRRKRQEYQIWDGRMESLQQAAAVHSNPGADPAHQLQAMALMADFTQGRLVKDQHDKMGETLEIVYTYQQDTQTPSFKVQMKQLVRRVVTTGVGYLRLNFSRDFEGTLATSDTESTIVDRVKAAKLILEKLERGDITEDSPDITALHTLMTSIGAATTNGDTKNVSERLVFDFPQSTSIIIDPACRNIKGFVGAKWIAQEYLLSLDEANAFFGTDIKGATELVKYNVNGEPQTRQMPAYSDASEAGLEDKDKERVCIWEVFSLEDKSSFFLCDGWKDFVEKPQPVSPDTAHFWPIFALTFNDIETEPGGKQKATIYPPSDVQLLRSPQKEWNRAREALRQQRKANAPKYMTGKGWLTDNDKDNLLNAMPNSVIEIEGAQPTSDIGKLLAPFQHAPIDQLAYDTSPLNQDMFLALGSEEGPQPASSKSTATAATINEQSRVEVASSNVDDLDDFLSTVAEAGGEMLLREMSEDSVKRIAGPGALWPDPSSVEDYVNSIYLNIVAASSGRPNKALELSNFQQVAPTLLAAGVNPVFIAREALKRLDDRLELDDAFPTGPQQAMPMMPQQQQQQPPSAAPSRGQTGPTREGQLQMPNGGPEKLPLENRIPKQQH